MGETKGMALVWYGGGGQWCASSSSFTITSTSLNLNLNEL
jgi:hypothetical protein